MIASRNDEFFAAVGRVFSSWSVLEDLMCQWFTQVLDGQQNETGGALRRVFNTAKSFSSKRDLLNAVVLDMPDDSIRQFLDRALDKAAQYSGFRNRLAHDLYVAVPMSGGDVMEIRKQRKPNARDEAITLEELKAAHQRIGQLNLLLLQVLARTRTPDDAMQELGQMPKSADSSSQ